MGFKKNRKRSERGGQKSLKGRKSDIFRKKSILMHRGTIDRIDNILRSGKLVSSDGKNGISLTEGITPIQGHGDTAIVFKKGFVKRAGFKGTRVDYDNKKHIEQFKILDDDLLQKFRVEMEEEADFRLKRSQVFVDALGTAEAIENHERLSSEIQTQMKQKISEEKIRSGQLREIRNWENEVFVDAKEITIDESEIVAIVTSYRFYTEYFPGLEKYADRCIFIDDLIRHEKTGEVHVLGLNFCDFAQKRVEHIRRIQQTKKLFLNMRESSIAAYHVACDLIHDPGLYSEIRTILPEISVDTPPGKLLDYLPRLTEIPNHQFKSNFIDYLGSRSMLPLGHQNAEGLVEKMDDLYISEIEARLV